MNPRTIRAAALAVTAVLGGALATSAVPTVAATGTPPLSVSLTSMCRPDTWILTADPLMVTEAIGDNPLCVPPLPTTTPPPTSQTETPPPTVTVTDPTLPPQPTTTQPTAPTTTSGSPPQSTSPAGCEPSYPTLCLPPGVDVDCPDLEQRDFPVVSDDPFRLDRDNDGIGCGSTPGQDDTPPAQGSSSGAGGGIAAVLAARRRAHADR